MIKKKSWRFIAKVIIYSFESQDIIHSGRNAQNRRKKVDVKLRELHTWKNEYDQSQHKKMFLIHSGLL